MKNFFSVKKLSYWVYFYHNEIEKRHSYKIYIINSKKWSLIDNSNGRDGTFFRWRARSSFIFLKQLPWYIKSISLCEWWIGCWRLLIHESYSTGSSIITISCNLVCNMFYGILQIGEPFTLKHTQFGKLITLSL